MKVFVTRQIPQKGLEMLKARFEVEIGASDRNLSRREICEGTKDADALVCLLSDAIDEEILSGAKKLKIIANYAVGYNNINVEYAKEHGIFVTNTPGVLTETTADLTWALMLSVARRIVEADKFTRSGKFKGWEPELMLGSDIFGKTLGVIGAGRIGQAVMKRAIGFGMRVIYYSKSRLPLDIESNLNASYVSLEKLLKEADFVSLHVPLTKNTYHMIGEDQLSLMKRTAYLINTARGPVVDEEALVKFLKEKRIAGAALDVFENEPLLTPGLTELDNVVITPHIGSASKETREKMSVIVAENVIAALEGKIPPNCVN
ncbi:MAG: D-glycerate dehydrogenase [Thermotogae bacterium]|nr:MAG: D-glycerate dehydrogenase [Thermotogota bacterium]